MTTHTDQSSSAPDSTVTLPTKTIVMWTVILAGVCAVGWLIVSWVWNLEPVSLSSGLSGLAVSFVMCVLGVVIMRPWKPRPILDWTTVWLGAMVFRLLATPVVAYLLYSAAPVRPTEFGLGVAIMYVLAVVGEAAVVAAHLKRTT